MIELKDLLEEDEVIVEFHLCNEYWSRNAITVKGRDDISGALEMTLHRILEAGGSENDVMRIMGAKIPTEEELKENHSKMPHGGFVISTGETGCEGNKHVIEYSLKLESNPEFTSSVLVAYARALSRMKAEGMTGCKTVFDVAPAYLSPLSADEIRAHLL